MRLAIQLQCKHLNLPISYKHIIQGTIYNMLSKEELGDFYHNQGYKRNEKKFKLFVFSDLYGKYKIENKRIVFEDIIKFYVSSLDNKFIKCIYEYLCNNENLFINKQIVKIVGVDFIGVDSFVGDKELIIKTLSPIVAYSTENKYVSYYKPSDLEFIKLVKENIISKVSAYQYPINDIVFEIKDVIKENKKIVYFKNTFYEAYQCEMKIKVNFDTLKLILETGLSAKGSCGFGMVYQKNEKNILSL